MSPDSYDFLVNYGKGGAVGRFRTGLPLPLRRGDRVVVRSERGLEVGVVLCPSGDRHARLLTGVLVGELLRPAGPEDDAALARLGPLADRLFEDSRQLVRELGLAAEVLDVEVLLDGRRAILQHVEAAACDWDGFVAALHRRHGVEVLLENLAAVAPPQEEADGHGGCGKPDCGRAEGGGCSTCGSGGGCSSCGSGGVELAAYFAHLRTQMEQRGRTPLL
jgi:hypothetical protein